MGKYYNRFLGKHIDLGPLGLEQRSDQAPYFCTPKGASILGWAGVDGIHYCFVRGFGEMVFAVSPMESAPDYVHPLASSFEDFLRLLLACRDANILEQAWRWTLPVFQQELERTESDQTACDTLDQIRSAMHLTPMDHPWYYMQELQNHFDYSKLRFSADLSDPDSDEAQAAPQWAVYYDGTIYGHSGRDRAGTEIPVNKTFQYAGRTFLVPAVYACAKGLVVDFCMPVYLQDLHRFMDDWNTHFGGRDGEDLTRRERLLLDIKNPLQFDFSPEMTVNGTVLKQKCGSGICYIPGDPSEPETRFLAEHYHLDRTRAWNLTRACFPWKTARRPNIKTLELTMIQEPVKIPGSVFTASVPGEQIDLHIPGHPMTLTVQALEPQTLDSSFLNSDSMEYPTCYSALSYTLSPTPEPETFALQDLHDCDQPRPKQTEQPGYGSQESAVLGIIGGADGPTAIFVGTPESKACLTACSAPRFEPDDRIQWLPILSVTQYDPKTFSLL